jgi:hypothetical protein
MVARKADKAVITVMDVPISAMILSLIGAIALGKLVVSVLAFVAETFFFSGESVSFKTDRMANC